MSRWPVTPTHMFYNVGETFSQTSKEWINLYELYTSWLEWGIHKWIDFIFKYHFSFGYVLQNVTEISSNGFRPLLSLRRSNSLPICLVPWWYFTLWWIVKFFCEWLCRLLYLLRVYGIRLIYFGQSFPTYDIRRQVLM